MNLALLQVAPLSSEVRRIVFSGPQVAAADRPLKWYTRLPSQNRAGAWSLRSGASQNTDAGSQAVLPARRRLAKMLSSLPGSSTQLYQMASRSPFGHSQIAGSWLWVLNRGPYEPGGV